jgi:hypothetical protein
LGLPSIFLTKTPHQSRPKSWHYFFFGSHCELLNRFSCVKFGSLHNFRTMSGKMSSI